MRKLFIFEPNDSFMHRMDAVSKFVWLVSVSVAVIVISDPLQNLIVFLYVLFVAVTLSRLNIKTLFRRSILVVVLALWTFITMALFYQTSDAVRLFSIGPFSVSDESIEFGLAMFFRVLSLGLTGMVYALTTHPRMLVHDFIEYGHLPYRIAYAFYAGLRFLPLIQSEAKNVMNAHAVRGVLSKGRSIKMRVAMVKRLTVPLMAITLRKVQSTAISMDARAFGAYPTRTSIEDRERSRLGVIFAIANVGILIIYIGLIYFLGGGLNGLANPLDIHRAK